MKKVPLTGALGKGKYALIDDSDWPIVKQYRWQLHPDGYVYGSRGRLHCYILHTPPALEIDHVDRDKLNNRKFNLRVCFHAENIRNRRISRNNTSGYKGVSWSSQTQRWRSAISVGGRKYYLGEFDIKEDAARAYNAAAIEAHGEFASLNKVA